MKELVDKWGKISFVAAILGSLWYVFTYAYEANQRINAVPELKKELAKADSITKELLQKQQELFDLKKRGLEYKIVVEQQQEVLRWLVEQQNRDSIIQDYLLRKLNLILDE